MDSTDTELLDALLQALGQTRPKLVPHDEGTRKGWAQHVKLTQVEATLIAVNSWWRIREDPDNHYAVKIKDQQRFQIEANHALRGGLLYRLAVQGHPAHAKPPPRQFSRPWYSLVDTGTGEAMEVWLRDKNFPGCEAPPEPGDKVVVDQSGRWILQAVHGPHDWTIKHLESELVCRAVRTQLQPWPKWVLTVVPTSVPQAVS